MSHQFTATTTQIESIQIIREYISGCIVENPRAVIQKTVKELWSIEQFESYQQIPISIRGAMEFSAKIVFDKGSYESTSSKKKDKRLCSDTGFSGTSPPFSLPDVYLPVLLLEPIPHFS